MLQKGLKCLRIKSREQTFKHIMLIYNIEKYLYSLKGIKMRKQQIKYKKLVQSYFLKRNDYDKLKNAFDKYLSTANYPKGIGAWVKTQASSLKV